MLTTGIIIYNLTRKEFLRLLLPNLRLLGPAASCWNLLLSGHSSNRQGSRLVVVDNLGGGMIHFLGTRSCCYYCSGAVDDCVCCLEWFNDYKACHFKGPL